MKNRITVERTAHYYIQIPSIKVKTILYVLHGYGQNAAQFIKEFDFLTDSSTLVVAPEALSKFYNKKREAVSSWMTSHERLDEINDYLKYLNQLHQLIKSKFDSNEIGILGFSQGLSTAMRWASQVENEKINLFACSGTIPPELKKEDFKGKALECHYFFGNQDPLLSVEKAQEQFKIIEELKLNCSSNIFDGGHAVSNSCKELIMRTFKSD